MNQAELERNKQLNSFHVVDLNTSPSLTELQENSFDFVTNAVR